MAIAKFSIKISATAPNLARGINAKKRKIERVLTKTLNEFEKWAVADVKNRIRNEKTDPNGNKWAPWSPNTRKKHRRHSLLYDTNTLHRNIKSKKLDKYHRVIGTPIPYAKFLQRGRTNMPARQILNLNTRKARIVFRAILRKKLRSK